MNENKELIEQQLQEIENLWEEKVNHMNEMMKTIPELKNLNDIIYNERQNAETYYHSVLAFLSKTNKDYRVKYANAYNTLKTSGQIRYTSETAIDAQIKAQLASELFSVEMLDHLASYMKETVKTIDNMIYGIRNRLEIEALITGTSLK